MSRASASRWLPRPHQLPVRIRRDHANRRRRARWARHCNEFAGFFQEYIALLAEAIRRGMEQGLFRTVDPTDAARVLMAMIQGTFAMAYLGNRPSQPPKKVAAALLDVYFQGIDAR